ncbi:hypothetical protein KP509_17G011900 [Ceratopteris richardii]|uniref:ABC transmembrane type-1 domain-containing protein n=1 Tax=Ceratopteris richardii TaxID=49495 RepID=A0A8T2SVL5_CERRI|nr:hypothetical protein KP509_17G011900 [Ceratopteris richardii]
MGVYENSMKLVRRLSSNSSRSEEQLQRGRSSDSFSRVNGNDKVAKLVDDEKREAGRVGWDVYWKYLTSAYGAWFMFLILAVQVVAQALSLCTDFWLSHETSLVSFNGGILILVYALLSMGSWVLTFARAFLTALFSLKAAQAFYERMLSSIFRSLMSFF